MEGRASGRPADGNHVHTILVVDDEDVVRNFMARALVNAGYMVVSAGNGREALALLKTSAVALVITDIRMPEMDGLELGAQISRLPLAPPVVYASASDNPPPGTSVWYLQKPFTAAELACMVQQILAR